jgi:hypothetical protein
MTEREIRVIDNRKGDKRKRLQGRAARRRACRLARIPLV